jgi:hypothetical protein
MIGAAHTVGSQQFEPQYLFSKLLTLSLIEGKRARSAAIVEAPTI